MCYAEFENTSIHFLCQPENLCWDATSDCGRLIYVTVRVDGHITRHDFRSVPHPELFHTRPRRQRIGASASTPPQHKPGPPTPRGIPRPGHSDGEVRERTGLSVAPSAGAVASAPHPSTGGANLEVREPPTAPHQHKVKFTMVSPYDLAPQGLTPPEQPVEA